MRRKPPKRRQHKSFPSCGGRWHRRSAPTTPISPTGCGDYTRAMNAPEKMKQYDRDAQAVGNIVHLEHFNVVINDQRLATLFYVVGLGGTRDPYIFMGLENMWVNFGRTQVHMPSRGNPPTRAEVVRGVSGFVVPDLAQAEKRLDYAGKEMKRVVPEKQTKFSFARNGG